MGISYALGIPKNAIRASAEGRYNVLAFGAKGDGIADDTSAFQQAINACIAGGGGEVEIPTPPVLNGFYRFKSGLVINAPNNNQITVWMRGRAQYRGVRLAYEPATGDFITQGANDGNHSGAANAYNGTAPFVVISGLWIDNLAGGVGGAGSSARGIVDWETGSAYYDRCTFSHWAKAYYGIGADESEFHMCGWLNCAVGAHLASRSDQNHFYDCNFGDCGVGILNEYAYAMGVHGGEFTFNTIADIQYDAPAAPTDGGDIRTSVGAVIDGAAWFEGDPTNGGPSQAHIWFGSNGAAGRVLTGLTIRDAFVIGGGLVNETFLLVDWGTRWRLRDGFESGVLTTSVNVIDHSGAGVQQTGYYGNYVSTLSVPVTGFTRLTRMMREGITDDATTDVGDVNYNFTPQSSPLLIQYNTPLTAARTVTLNTIGGYNGMRVRVVREAGCTGAFNITVSGVNLTAAKQWVEFMFSYGAWVQIASGTLL